MYTNFYDYFIFYVDHRIHEYLCMCVSLYVCVSLCVHYISSEIWQLMFPIFLFWSHFFSGFFAIDFGIGKCPPVINYEEQNREKRNRNRSK